MKERNLKKEICVTFKKCFNILQYKFQLYPSVDEFMFSYFRIPFLMFLKIPR